MGRYPEHRVGQLALGITTGHTSWRNLKDVITVGIEIVDVQARALLTYQS